MGCGDAWFQSVCPGKGSSQARDRSTMVVLLISVIYGVPVDIEVMCFLILRGIIFQHSAGLPSVVLTYA